MSGEILWFTVNLYVTRIDPEFGDSSDPRVISVYKKLRFERGLCDYLCGLGRHLP